MDKGIYTALSGGLAKSHEIDIIANNLANANTPGYKKDTGTFSEYIAEFRRMDTAAANAREIHIAANMGGRVQGDKSFVEMDGIYTDYSQGFIQRSGRPLDLALKGKGFFEVLTPSGVRYTRQGNFSINKDGLLVTSNGFSVLSQGDIGSAQQRTIQLDRGPVQIAGDGFIYQNGQQIGQIAIREFKETQLLEKSGNSYYRNVSEQNAKTGEIKSQIHQGYIEASNVNAIHEMTKLIQATRAYETHMQAIKMYQEIDARSVNDIARGMP